MNTVSLDNHKNATAYHKVGRKNEVKALEALKNSSQTQQKIANELGVPRTTLQCWKYRKRFMQTKIDPAVVAFYESPAGLAHLHQIMTAMTYTFHKTSGCGLPAMQTFLKLSQLNHFVASSTGMLHKLSKKMDEHITTFGHEETERLAEKMPGRNISVVGDETFLPGQMILVMMDPVSNFILTEEVKDKRDAANWNMATTPILEKLNVQVIQFTGDEGSGLTSFALNVLGAHKAPDLFHVQQDITKAIGGYLSRMTKIAAKTLEEFSGKAENMYEKASKLLLEPGADLQNPSKQLARAIKKTVGFDKEREENEIKFQQLIKDREIVSQSRQTIGTVYHPFDLETGDIRTPEVLEESLSQAYDRIEEVSVRNGCSDKQNKKLSKSRAMIPSLKNTLAFFWCQVTIFLQNLHIIPELEDVFRRFLLPIAYLKIRLSKCRDRKLKNILETTIASLEDGLHSRDGPWNNTPPEEQIRLIAKAEECSGIFQRSSSCVEGRNGVLSLLHHGQKRLSGQRLRVLTIIHNFAITRRDGTTAAERFFGQKHRDLFDYLLEKMEWPLRPRQKWSSVKQNTPGRLVA